MSLTLSQLASRVLRNVEIPEDSSTTQALTDAKAYINERARKIWRSFMFPEYIILGTYEIPASTRKILLTNITIDSDYSTSANGYNASFALISAIREGSNPLMPEDAGAIQKVQPDLWASTTTPVNFVDRGQLGIALLGYYSTTTTLSFFGKAAFQDLSDSETWILDPNGDALLAGATADMLRHHERDDPRANLEEQNFIAEFNKLIHERKVQGADITRVIPLNPWTKDFTVSTDTTKIGIGNPFD